jgi:class 3 adenylate cyclase/tetratricopeptide (TPR) repeat protein
VTRTMQAGVGSPPPARSAPAPAKHPNIASERRIITVLAVDIVGSMPHIAECDPDDAQAFFDRCFDHVRRVIEPAGGSLVSFEGDGGIAAFGWPGAHEDHADRACAAAWDIQHGADTGVGPDGRPVQFRVGVHSGLVALRKVRRGGRSRLDTVGATVHIAAKLQQNAAPGGILVSAEVIRLCRARLDLLPRPTPPVLDRVTTNVFSLEGPPAGRRTSELEHRYSLPMIGRQPELARLRKDLPRSRGRSAAVAIVGEPGIGKSRLAAAAVAEAIALNARILVFFGDAQKRTTPFAVVRSLIDDLLRSPAVPPENARAALAAAGLEMWEIAAVHPSLGALHARRRRKRAQLTERQLARLFVKAFCALARERPTLLLVEDLHLIDSESREFLHILADTPTRQPLCMLITGRPESIEWAEEIVQSVMILESLPKSVMKAIGRQSWPSGRPSRAMLDLLVSRADGVPFVLEELIHALEDNAGGRPNALPQSIGSLIHVRLQRLSADARALAQALSLLGTNVDLELAGDVLGRGTESLLEELVELERFAFVHPLTGGSIRMRHQITSEACAETIPHRRRKELHKAALRAIRSRFFDPAGRYEQLAFHAEGAGDAGAAVQYLWEAALEARRNSAAVSLSLLFDRAIALIERLGAAGEPKYVEFVLMAFASMVQLGEFDKVNRHLPRVMELTRRSGQPALICSTLSQLGMICWFEGRYDEGLRATEEGLALARTLQSPALIYSNLIMQTNILHGMGRVRRAIAEQQELCEMLSGDLETARLGAASIPSATALSFLSWFMMDIGAYAEGLAVVERGLAIAKREGDAYSEVLARHQLGRNLLLLHRNAEAVECIAIAREISEREGYDAIKADLDGRMAIALTRTGRAAEAIRLVEDCLRRKLHRRTGQLEVYYLYAGYAEALLRTGEIERGLAMLADALAVARKIHNPCLIVDALGLRARMLADVAPGDARIAADLAERAEICALYGLAAWPDVTCPERPSPRSA